MTSLCRRSRGSAQKRAPRLLTWNNPHNIHTQINHIYPPPPPVWSDRFDVFMRVSLSREGISIRPETNKKKRRLLHCPFGITQEDASLVLLFTHELWMWRRDASSHFHYWRRSPCPYDVANHTRHHNHVGGWKNILKYLSISLRFLLLLSTILKTFLRQFTIKLPLS